jgi:hypothetical protein
MVVLHTDLISAPSTNAKSVAAIMFEVVNIITLGNQKHEHDFYDIRSAAMTVLYIFLKNSSSIIVSRPEF